VKTTRVTTAEAIVRWLIAQRTTVDGVDVPLFPGVFAIFGHGNVTSLGHALEQARAELPTWRGQNEQGMALAAIAYAKAMRRRQIMVATSSIGPGATNMVTAAGVAMANRLPLLLLSGDTFASRTPDPVLQQIERFDEPSATVNDAFRPVVRYWNRITRPQQLLHTLPEALATMLDPGSCGPVFLGLPQDVQAEAFEFPAGFFEPVVRSIPRPRPDRAETDEAVRLLQTARRPLIVAGGGVHYSLAEQDLAAFAAAHRVPVVETVAGKSCVLWDHPCYAGPIGVTGVDGANGLAAEADVVLAIGTRLQDFTTGSWTVFDESVRIIGCNAARYDAGKHNSIPLVGDALECLAELDQGLGGWQAPEPWLELAQREAAREESERQARTRPAVDGTLATYAQVVGAVDRLAAPDDYALTAAGGLPGELNTNWRSHGVATFDCEYGYSCMGYELSGAWGARMARPRGDIFAFVGDGSYLMMNSDLYSSVLSGHKVIAIVCDNGGYAVIDRLQRAQGGVSFNNMLADSVRVDFVAHAAALGCDAQRVKSIAELESAVHRARSASHTTVIVIETDPDAWTEGGAFWEVGVPETSEREAVQTAREAMVTGKRNQRSGW
jgi:3D-(3,5/4)-trihydroxycyclohexane-1,2-dione acylhydrolase (decyclizing)